MGFECKLRVAEAQTAGSVWIWTQPCDYGSLLSALTHVGWVLRSVERSMGLFAAEKNVCACVHVWATHNE